MSERRNGGTGFAPDYVFPPGVHMHEKLDEMGMSQAQFARKAGLSQKHVSQVLNGKVPLSVDVAVRFEKTTGMSARLLLDIEAGYALSEYRRTHVSGPDQLAKANGSATDQPTQTGPPMPERRNRSTDCEHIVHVPLPDGRTVRMDKLKECEEALRVVEGLYDAMCEENDRIMRVIDRYRLQHDHTCAWERAEEDCDCGLEAAVLHLPTPDSPYGREPGVYLRTDDGACVVCGATPDQPVHGGSTA